MQKTDTLSHSRKISRCRVIELGAGGWGGGGGRILKSCKDPKCGGVALAVRYEPEAWREYFFFFFFKTEICSREEEMCVITKLKILHQKCCKVR